MQSSEEENIIATLEVNNEMQQNDDNNIQDNDSISSLDLKGHINLTDLPLNDDSYLNSAIEKEKLFDDISLKKNKIKYKNNNDDNDDDNDNNNDNDNDTKLLNKVKTNININSASLNTLASYNSSNVLNRSTNLNSYIDDGSMFDLKASHQLSIVNSNTTINVSEENHNMNNELKEPHHELTENEFIDIDLEDKVENMVKELTDSTDLQDSELNYQDKTNQYEEYDVNDILVNSDMILKSLLNIDNGSTVLLNRVKQNCNSCKEITTFLKKRALIEEEYGKSMLKLTQSALENLDKVNINRKLGTFHTNYIKFIKMHEKVGENHVKFAQIINDTYDNISTTLKNTERSRKQLKDAGLKYKKNLSESDAILEKTRQKYEMLSQNWDETLQEKEKYFSNEQVTLLKMNSGNIGSVKNLYNTKRNNKLNINIFRSSQTNPQKLMKNEDDARFKVAIQNENYITQLNISNNLRNEYNQIHIPGLLKSLKDTNDECDQILQEQLKNYSLNYEEVMKDDAAILTAEKDKKDASLSKLIESINNKKDLSEFIQLNAYEEIPSTLIEVNETDSQNENQENTKRITCYEFIKNSAEADPQIVFGEDLNEIIKRENTEVPLILTKCIRLIEDIGIETPGLYRFSGSNNRIQHLKALFNKNSYLTTINNIINTDNINDITGLVKLFFRELPDPLLIRGLYHQFIEASKIEDERRRLIEIHELVNKLPDANYLSLRFLIGHLFKVQSHQDENKMSASNLSIIWGPILLDNSNNSIIINPEDENHESSADLPSDSLIDFQYKCKVVEVIISNYLVIFDPES